MGWLFAAIGTFAICGALFEWGWFMNHRKAQRLESLVGRSGARIFYGVLGLALVVFGVLQATGVLREAP